MNITSKIRRQDIKSIVCAVSCNSNGGNGSVSSVSAGGLTPIFTTSVTAPTSTPSISFALIDVAINKILAGPANGAPSAPSYRSLVSQDIPSLPYLPLSGGSITGDLSVSGNVTLGALSGGDLRLVTANASGVLGTTSIRGTYISIAPAATFTSTTETRYSGTVKISAGDIVAGDEIGINVVCGKVGTSSGYNLRVYYNTTDNLSGATQLAIASPLSANLYMRFVRSLTVKTLTTQVVFNTALAGSTDIGTFNSAPSQTTINFNADVFLIFTFQLASTGDTITMETVKINLI